MDCFSISGILHFRHGYFKTEVGAIDKAGIESGARWTLAVHCIVVFNCNVTTLEGIGQGLQYCGWSNKNTSSQARVVFLNSVHPGVSCSMLYC